MVTRDLRSRLGDESTLQPLLAELAVDPQRLPVLFPGLPRRSGRRPVGGGRVRIGSASVDLNAFRSCDLAASVLLLEQGADEAAWFDLYAHGDIEERAMLLRALHFLPPGPTTARLLQEVQRTNIVMHVEAALCDGDLLPRALQHGAIDRSAANKLLLKLAFLDLPFARVLDGERCADAELSRMLLDLASEREAAGRSVWRDTLRLIGRAPCAGTPARLVGALEHGDDGVRLAAAEGLLALGRTDLAPFAQERLPREPRAEVRDLLQRLCNRTDGAARC